MIEVAQSAVAIPSALIVAVVTALLSGGVVSAYIAFRRAPADRESIAVQTMELVNDELRKYSAGLEIRLAALVAENATLHERIAVLEHRAGLRPAD